jgi:hypothetical protein
MFCGSARVVLGSGVIIPAPAEVSGTYCAVPEKRGAAGSGNEKNIVYNEKVRRGTGAAAGKFKEMADGPTVQKI